MTRAVVLAVDDDTDLLALIAKVLSAEYQVLTASDTRESLVAGQRANRTYLAALGV